MLLAVIGSFFSFAAAVTAFLITMNEYLRGRNPNRRLALWMSLKSALVTLAIFAALTVGIGFALSKIL